MLYTLSLHNIIYQLYPISWKKHKKIKPWLGDLFNRRGGVSMAWKSTRSLASGVLFQEGNFPFSNLGEADFV